MIILVALLGLLLAVVAGAFFRISAAFFGRFADRVILRALIAGAIFSVVGVIAPIVMFSGEDQVQTVVADPAKYGIGLLLVMALVKLALLAVAFKSGFFGGPTFPAIFASVCVALALSLALPGVPLDVLIAGVMAGFLIVLFKAPFMVILLTAFMLQASVDLTALIVIAVATVLIVQPYLLAFIAARQAARSERRARPAADRRSLRLRGLARPRLRAFAACFGGKRPTWSSARVDPRIGARACRRSTPAGSSRSRPSGVRPARTGRRLRPRGGRAASDGAELQADIGPEQAHEHVAVHEGTEVAEHRLDLDARVVRDQ